MKKIILMAVCIMAVLQTKSQTPTFVNANNDYQLSIHNNGCSNACSSDVDVDEAITLNCDMYWAGADGRLWVVAYTVMDIGTLDPNAGPPCFWFLNTPTLHSAIYADYTGTLPLANNNHDICLSCHNPDIVIGDDYNLGSGFNIIGVVCNSTNGMDVEIRTLAGNHIGDGVMPGPSIGNQSVPIILTSTSGRIARDPHIDLFADASNQVHGGVQALNKFIVTWTEHDPMGPTDYVMAAIGDLNNPGSYSGPYTISSDGISPDVGALGINGTCCSTSTDYAYITYIEASSGDLKLAELDITGTTLNGTTISTLSVQGTDHSTIEAPRIEARNFADPTDVNVNWQVAVSLVPSSGSDYLIRTFNDVATPTTLNCSNGEQHWSPAVTGVGDDIDQSGTGRIGEISFSVAYYSTYINNGGSNGDIFANEIDMSTGAMPANDYHEVNNTALETGHTSSSGIPVAATNTSNTGDDLFVVWYNGKSLTAWGLFYYNFGGNTYSFKPAKPSIVGNTVPEGVNIYPNPVTDKLNIQHSAKSDFEITDATGRLVLKGIVDNEQYSINISGLSAGVYLIHLTKNGEVEHMKFVKQ